MRKLTRDERTLEIHYGGFVFSQRWTGAAIAKQLAFETSYGSVSAEVFVGANDARMYRLGPEVPPDDVDGREPSVVTWADGEMFYLVASGQLEAEVLKEIAESAS